MSAGDLQVRMRVSGDDEVAALGRALDHLAGSLWTTLTELRGERDLLERILQSMREGVLVLDADRRILLVNPALGDSLLLGTSVQGLAPLEAVRNADLQELLDRAFASNEAAAGEIETGGLTRRRLLVRASPLPAAQGQARGLLAVFVDVTEMRRLETLRTDFVANVSHELRTPSTAVRSAVETLRHTIERDPASSALHRHDRPQRAAPRHPRRGSAGPFPHRIARVPARAAAARASPRRRAGRVAPARQAGRQAPRARPRVASR